jgi:hypothetical protein
MTSIAPLQKVGLKALSQTQWDKETKHLRTTESQLQAL